MDIWVKRLYDDVGKGRKLVAVDGAGILRFILIRGESRGSCFFFNMQGFCLVEKLATNLTCGCRRRWFVEAHLWVPVLVLCALGPPLG